MKSNQTLKIQDRKFSLKKVIAMVLIAIFLTTSVSYYVFSSPSPSRDIYFDDLSSTATYVINNDGSGNYWATRDDGKVFWEGADDDITIQNAIDSVTSSGGLIFVKQGSYSASVTVTNNVVLILEAGVTGLSYTTSGAGIVMRYASGYVILDAPLNMTQKQIIYGVFHSGSARPSNPVEGQFFYDTDDKAMFVYNGTAWEDYSGTGSQGPQGPAGVTYAEYNFRVWLNGSTYEVRNYTGTLEWSGASAVTAIQWSINNMPSAGGIISLDENVNAVGTVVMNKTKISMVGRGAQGNYGDDYPLISKLLINATEAGEDIRGIKFVGIDFREIRFFTGPSATYEIRWVYFINCKVRSSGTANQQGIIFEATDTGSGNADFIYFINCYFYQTGFQSGYGFITVLPSAGAYFKLVDSDIYMGVNGGTVLYLNSGDVDAYAYLEDFIVATGSDDIELIRFNATDGNNGVDVIWNGGSVEVGLPSSNYNMTVATIGGSAGTTAHFYANIFGIRWMIKSTSTLRLLNNQHNTGAWWRQSQFMFHDNYNLGQAGSHTITLGNLNEGSYFQVYVYDNGYGFPTSNRGSSEASNNDWIEHGLGAWSDGLTPEVITLSVEETDARYIINPIAKNNTHFQISLYFANDTACTTDKTIIWYVEAYHP